MTLGKKRTHAQRGLPELTPNKRLHSTNFRKLKFAREAGVRNNNMIFVFVEDGTLEIIEELEEARRNYEGIDVESGVYDFYNEAGTYLKAVFTKPN